MDAVLDCELFDDAFRKTKRKSQFLFCLLLLYVLAGALIFQTLEHDDRESTVIEALEDFESQRQELLEVLWAETIARGEQDWAHLANQKLNMYEKLLSEHLLNGIDVENSDNGNGNNPWTFIGSAYYAFTVVTTIGYGSFCPVTCLGKLVTILYALFGIPLTLIYLGEIGKVLTVILKALMRKKWRDQYDSSDEFNFVPPLAVGFTAIFLLFGAFLFKFLERDWSILDAFYFNFITASTVGFGDFSPDTDTEKIVLMVYSLSALSLCGLCFTSVQEWLDSALDNKKDKLYWWWQKQRAYSKKSDVPTSGGWGEKILTGFSRLSDVPEEENHKEKMEEVEQEIRRQRREEEEGKQRKQQEEEEEEEEEERWPRRAPRNWKQDDDEY